MGTSGALLLTGYPTPASIHRTGVRRLTTWLPKPEVRSPESLAARSAATFTVLRATTGACNGPSAPRPW
ncbi:hypothetical protein [Streptomyces sp. NPDC020362]|uniref:hypothetical protein n=1 Tax=Streptomyces sp. NPDC020362 TaxID=3154486 RepID=UPI000AD173A5